MPQPRSRTGFTQKTKPRRFISEISLADDFQCDGAVQIDVERLVSDPHRTATQLDRSTVFGLEEFVMLKAQRHRFSRRRERRLARRRVRCRPRSERSAKHAKR